MRVGQVGVARESRVQPWPEEGRVAERVGAAEVHQGFVDLQHACALGGWGYGHVLAVVVIVVIMVMGGRVGGGGLLSGFFALALVGKRDSGWVGGLGEVR